MPWKDPERRREYHRKYYREYNLRKSAEDPGYYRKIRLRKIEANPEFSKQKNEYERERRRRKLLADPEYYRKERLRKMELGPIKYEARRVIYEAVRSGRLVRPEACSSCGGTGSKIHGHHEDYSKPLEVEWLCHPCHTLIHR